jgi:hypothetical protein
MYKLHDFLIWLRQIFYNRDGTTTQRFLRFSLFEASPLFAKATGRQNG